MKIENQNSLSKNQVQRLLVAKKKALEVIEKNKKEEAKKRNNEQNSIKQVNLFD